MRSLLLINIIRFIIFLNIVMKDIPFEDKPIEILRFPRLTIYSNFKKHKDFYDFFNSGKVVDDFVRNVKYKFKLRGKKMDQRFIHYRKHSEFTLSRFKTNY